jgi:hypothetical protein
LSIVETDIENEDTGPQTPEEWREANLEATLHTIVENMVLRSESEKVVLHALIDGLDKNPDEVIQSLEIAPINTGGGGYVDPVTAQILADNAALRNDVRELLDALKNNGANDSAVVAQAETDIGESVTQPPALPTQPSGTVSPIQSPPPVVAPANGNTADDYTNNGDGTFTRNSDQTVGSFGPNGFEPRAATQEEPAAQNTVNAPVEVSAEPHGANNAPEGENA